MPIICEHLKCKREKRPTEQWWTLYVKMKENGNVERVYMVKPIELALPKRYLFFESFNFCSHDCLMIAESRVRDGLDPRI